MLANDKMDKESWERERGEGKKKKTEKENLTGKRQRDRRRDQNPRLNSFPTNTEGTAVLSRPVQSKDFQLQQPSPILRHHQFLCTAI